MIVLDASALIEWLLRTPSGRLLAKQVISSGETLHAPHLVDVEVAQVLRRYTLTGSLEADRAKSALQDLADLGLSRYPHTPLMTRVWELRGNLTAYDAVYVALAEELNATLMTRDRKLASAPGHHAHIQIV